MKIGSSYYHQSCHGKLTTKRESYDILTNGMGFIAKQVNMILKKHIDDEGVPYGYLLWMLNKIYSEKLTLNNPYGFGYYLKEGRNWKEYKKLTTLEEYKKLKSENVEVETIEPQKFTWKKKGVSYGQILK